MTWATYMGGAEVLRIFNYGGKMEHSRSVGLFKAIHAKTQK